MKDDIFEMRFIKILINAGILENLHQAGSTGYGTKWPLYSPENLIGKIIKFKVRSTASSLSDLHRDIIKISTYASSILGVSTHEELDQEQSRINLCDIMINGSEYILIIISPIRVDHEVVRALKVDSKGMITLSHRAKDPIVKFAIVD